MAPGLVLGDFDRLKRLYYDLIDYSAAAAPPYFPNPPINYPLIKWVHVIPKPRQSFRYGTVYCFTNTRKGLEKMRKWLESRRKGGDARYGAAIDRVLKLFANYTPPQYKTTETTTQTTTTTTTTSITMETMTDKDDEASTFHEDGGCSEVFDRPVSPSYPPLGKNRFPTGNRIQNWYDSTRQPQKPPWELWLPDLAVIGELSQYRGCDPAHPTWEDAISSAIVYSGCLILNDRPGFAGVWYFLWGPQNQLTDPPSKYPDLSTVGFDDKAESSQQV